MLCVNCKHPQLCLGQRFVPLRRSADIVVDGDAVGIVLPEVPYQTAAPADDVLKEISPGCSLEGLMLKLKLQYFGHLMRRAESLEKTLMLGGIGGRRRRG